MYVALLIVVALVAAGGCYVYHEEITAFVEKVKARLKK